MLSQEVQHVKLFGIGVVNFKDSRTSRWFPRIGNRFRSL